MGGSLVTVHLVGAGPGAPSPSQDEINALLVDRGRRFSCVVRLKGGDPLVFGRSPATIVVGAVASADVLAIPELAPALTAGLRNEEPAPRRPVPELGAPALTVQGVVP